MLNSQAASMGGPCRRLMRGISLLVLLLGMSWGAPAPAQVQLIESEARATGSGSIRPPSGFDPFAPPPPGTESCGQSTTPIAPDSVDATEAVACGVRNAFGGGAFTSEYLLDIDDTQGTVSEIFLSAQANCNTDPFEPPTFRQATVEANGSAEVTVEVEITAPVVATFTFNGAVDENVAPVPPGRVGQGFGIGSALATLRSPPTCTPGVNCDREFQHCLTTDFEPCQDDDPPPSLRLEPGVYQFRVRAGVRSDSSSDTRLGLAADASASASLLVRFEVPTECDMTWNSFAPGNVGSGENVFADSNNWSPRQVPADDGAGCNRLLVDRSDAFNIFVNGDQAAGQLRVNTGQVNLRFGPGGALRLSDADRGGLLVGQGADVAILGGVVNAPGVSIGEEAGGDGTAGIRVAGAGSQLVSRGVRPDDTAEREINLGGNQDAALSIEGGASAAAGSMNIGFGFPPSAGDGTVTVSGADGATPSVLAVSGPVVVGDDRSGTLTVSAGGRFGVLNGADLRLGLNGNASLLVEGASAASGAASSVAIAGDLNAGGNSGTTSDIVVLGGASLTARQVRVGFGGPATLTMDGGASLETLNALTVSARNPSRVDVAGGSQVALGAGLFVGNGAGGTGSMSISGSTATTDVSATTVVVGSNGGTGVLRVRGNANLRGTSLTAPTSEAASDGALLLEDGAIAGFGAVEIGNTGRGRAEVGRGAVLDVDTAVEVLGRGRLLVRPGGTVIAPRVRVVERGGRVIGTRQRGKQDDDAPGTIQGNLELADGAVLELEALPGDAPALLVEGDFTAAGTLEVSFPADGALEPDETFALLGVTGESTGAFAEVIAQNRGGDFAATATLDGGTLQVTVLNPGTPLDPEGEEEGEGEGGGDPDPPAGCAGCGGCDAKGGPVEKALGDWLAAFLGLSALLATHLHFRRQAPTRRVTA